MPFHKHLHFIALSGLVFVLSGCIGGNPLLAPSIAEPDTRPARNFTSFSGALDCMDQLLSQSNRRRVLISSTDIPDETNMIKVGADDMLINAISQMNRRSQSYIFVDQALIKFGGLLDVEVQNGDEVKPQFYIRGSISQLDRDVTNDEGSVSLTPGTGNLVGTKYGRHRKLSVVSVDMHLVAYPSRRVIAGASVANSMVVVGQGFGTSASGLISLATLGFSIKVNRVESQSQAVRNLIEVGLIELLGRHAGVPYWTCLSKGHTSGKDNGRQERKFVRSKHFDPTDAVPLLAQLGYLPQGSTAANEQDLMVAVSQFQANERLLPNGLLDFDLMVLLERRVNQTNKPKPVQVVRTPQVRPSVTKPRNQIRKPVVQAKHAPIPAEPRGVGCAGASPGKPCDDGYINLQDFLKKQ